MSQNEKKYQPNSNQQQQQHRVVKEQPKPVVAPVAQNAPVEPVKEATQPQLDAKPVSIKEQVKSAQQPNTGVRIGKDTKVLSVKQLPAVSKDGIGYELPSGNVYLVVNGIFKKVAK